GFASPLEALRVIWFSAMAVLVDRFAPTETDRAPASPRWAPSSRRPIPGFASPLEALRVIWFSAMAVLVDRFAPTETDRA
ncbi:hypothetical protein CTI14_68310, partial [Methylobacterium radiotolerans]